MEVDEIDPLWFEEPMEIEDNEMTVEVPLKFTLRKVNDKWIILQ